MPETIELNEVTNHENLSENSENRENSEVEVLDDADKDDAVVPEQYNITSFGADYDVEGLVKRLERGDILIPSFQRDYVWNATVASRFIESLLLGLPVPGIFLARETDTNRLLVIDGQQRLKTLQFFYQGVFNPKQEEKTQRVFKLTKVQPIFEGCTYDTLEEQNKVKLNDSIIHATVIKQESPDDDNTSVYHIFERLNNGSQKLAPQELRTAIYHGNLIDTIKGLNDYDTWRNIFGKKHARLKDQELILRFLAFYYNYEKYERPMEEFLNKFASKNRRAKPQFINGAEKIFEDTIEIIWSSLGTKAFRPERAFNAAAFDSVMVGIAQRIAKGGAEDVNKVRTAYNKLMADKEYSESISQATADEANVKFRFQKAVQAFAEV